MHHLFSKLSLSLGIALSFVFFFANHAFAYDLVNIPATIRDNGRDFPATIIAVGTSLTPPGDLDNGFNPFVGQVVSGYVETNPNTPISATLPDFPFPIGGVNELVEFAKLTDIESITINGTVFPAFVLAQLPNYQNIIVAALVTRPATLTTVQGPYGAQWNGIEQVSNGQVTGQSHFNVDVELADLDGDGMMETVFSTDNILHAMRADLFELPGFPVAMPNTSSQNLLRGVSVGDVVSSFPGLEIVTVVPNATVSGSLDITVIGAAGNVLVTVPNLGFPSSVTFDTTGNLFPPMLADIDGNGDDEIVIVTRNSSYHDVHINVIDGNGAPLAGYPAMNVITYPLFGNIGNQSGPAIGNVDADSALEVVIRSTTPQTTQPQVIIYDTVSRVVQNTISPPFTTAYSYLLLANLDNDPALEITIQTASTQAPWLSVYNADGTLVPGWPVYLNTIGIPPLSAGPAFAGDVEGDGSVEIGVDSAGVSPPPTQTGFWRSNGISLLAFPAPIGYSGGTGGGGTRLIDVDLDGVLDLVKRTLTSSGVQLTAFRTLPNPPTPATLVSGFPFPALASPGGNFYYGPTLGDIDGDGVLEAVLLRLQAAGAPISTPQGEITVLKIALYNGGIASQLPFSSGFVNAKNTNAVP